MKNLIHANKLAFKVARNINKELLASNPAEKCSRVLCSYRAQWIPMIHVFAKGAPIDSKPLIFQPSMQVCNAHREISTLDQVLSENLWLEICKKIDAANYKEPDRSRTYLRFEPFASLLQVARATTQH